MRRVYNKFFYFFMKKHANKAMVAKNNGMPTIYLWEIHAPFLCSTWKICPIKRLLGNKETIRRLSALLSIDDMDNLIL
jgi:hypothetical protein